MGEAGIRGENFGIRFTIVCRIGNPHESSGYLGTEHEN
jgi:hypothetical protein